MKTVTMFWHYEHEAHVLYRVTGPSQIEEVAHFTVEGGGYFELCYNWPNCPEGVLFRNGTVAEMKDEIALEVDASTTDTLKWLSKYSADKCYKSWVSKNKER